ncbi:hypothetical protein ACS0ZG_24330 [Burkholderia gladioli]|nr:hypothetical protein [Burkholderia gladioli]
MEAVIDGMLGDALDTAEQALLPQFGRVRLSELARRVRAAAE